MRGDDPLDQARDGYAPLHLASLNRYGFWSSWTLTVLRRLDLSILFRAATDLVVAVHAVFVVFVVLGGVLVARWPHVAWLHLPAAVWGVLIELVGWTCPLTPLENYLRERGGASPYPGDFIERYVLPVLYPARLTRELQIWLALLAIAINLALYTYVILRARRNMRAERS